MERNKIYVGGDYEIKKKCFYKVKNQKNLVNSFLEDKIIKFGILKNDNYSKEVVDYAISGNNLGQLEFHLPNIKKTLKFQRNVYIDQEFYKLKDFLIFKKDEFFQNYEIIVNLKYKNLNNEIKPQIKSLAILLEIFGKIYHDKIHSHDKIYLMKIFNSITNGADISHARKRLRKITRRIKNMVVDENYPANNIFNKILETIDEVF